jgi:hypothetical protein
MSSYSHLFTTNAITSSDIEKEDSAQGFGYLTAQYRLPPFWTALFTKDDLKLDETRDRRGAATRNWILLAPKAKALDTLKSREAFLLSTLGEHVSGIFEQFATYLESAKGANVLVQTDELAAMLEDELPENYWQYELSYCIEQLSGKSSQQNPLKPYPQSDYMIGGALGYANWPQWGADVDGVGYVYILAGGGFEDVPWQEGNPT